MAFRLLLGAGLACAILAAAPVASAGDVTPPSIAWSSPEKRVLLIEPSVELGELTTGGVIEPRADWSDSATHNIEASFSATLGQHGIQVATLETLTDPHDIQLAKLHAVVGMEVLIHRSGLSTLPTKHSALDWTLGPGANALRVEHGADYGMFVFVRDSYSSDARKAMMVLGMATGGSQIAFASLVDLRTGNLVWFNQLFTTFGGDLRTPAGATEFTAALLKDLPL